MAVKLRRGIKNFVIQVRIVTRIERNDNNEEEEGRKREMVYIVSVTAFRPGKLSVHSQCNKSWLSNFFSNGSARKKRKEVVTFLEYQIQV